MQRAAIDRIRELVIARGGLPVLVGEGWVLFRIGGRWAMVDGERDHIAVSVAEGLTRKDAASLISQLSERHPHLIVDRVADSKVDVWLRSRRRHLSTATSLAAAFDDTLAAAAGWI